MKKAAIALLNAKGGVGKTTGAINIASMAAALGKKVLICDLDPQMNATQQLGFDNIEPQHTLAEVTYDSELNQTTEDWHTRLVTLSATKGLSERCFAPLSMTAPKYPPSEVYQSRVVRFRG